MIHVGKKAEKWLCMEFGNKIPEASTLIFEDIQMHLRHSRDAKNQLELSSRFDRTPQLLTWP